MSKEGFVQTCMLGRQSMNPNLMEQIFEIERLVHRPVQHQAPDPLVQDHNEPIIMDQPKPLKDYFIPN